MGCEHPQLILLCSAVVGVLALYLFAFVYKTIGEAFGGSGDAASLRAAVGAMKAWGCAMESGVPGSWGFAIGRMLENSPVLGLTPTNLTLHCVAK